MHFSLPFVLLLPLSPLLSVLRRVEFWFHKRLRDLHPATDRVPSSIGCLQFRDIVPGTMGFVMRVRNIVCFIRSNVTRRSIISIPTCLVAFLTHTVIVASSLLHQSNEYSYRVCPLWTLNFHKKDKSFMQNIFSYISQKQGYRCTECNSV